MKYISQNINELMKMVYCLQVASSCLVLLKSCLQKIHSDKGIRRYVKPSNIYKTIEISKSDNLSNNIYHALIIT